jgi:hypothetical protein
MLATFAQANQQQKAHRTEQQKQQLPGSADHLLFEGHNQRFHFQIGRQRLFELWWKRGLNAAGDSQHVRARALDRDARAQTTDHRVRRIVQICEHLIGGEAQRYPQVGMLLQPHSSGWKRERLRHHSDHLVWKAVDQDRTSQD